MTAQSELIDMRAGVLAEPHRHDAAASGAATYPALLPTPPATAAPNARPALRLRWTQGADGRLHMRWDTASNETDS